MIVTRGSLAAALRFLFASLALFSMLLLSGLARADEDEDKEKKKPDAPKYPPFNVLLKDAESIPTDPAARPLFKLYKKGQNLYAELGGGVFNQDLIVSVSIARGVGFGDVLGGMSLNFGNDWLWQFRRTDDDKIQIIRRNIRFKAKSGSPEADAVKTAYTDSILFNLPIATMGSGGPVVDLTPVFMNDLPGIASSLPGYGFVPSRSSWASVKAFDDNVEIEVAGTFSGGSYYELETVPDGRNATVHIHYSISKLPQNGYQPRLADDRVGYFLTVVKDYSKSGEEDRFVRYINRWDLKKKDPSLAMSPPAEPIRFYLEKTIPIKYRQSIREGILAWNKAFERLGFYNAIEVLQQDESATWDPEDIRYNTFRWITSGAGFAMGPSRVNPTNGQILDADIIFDSDFIEFWKDEYETFTPKGIAAMTGGPLDLASYQAQMKLLPQQHRHSMFCRCDLHTGRSRDYALAATVFMSRKFSEEDIEKLVMQGIKEVTMHEVGHTLGLRHNFKASSTISLADLNDPEKTKDKGLTSSVMDYAPANLMPKDAKQGDYYSQTIGPYDMWAIEYGYTTKGSEEELKKIAARSGEPELAYATDEDTRGIDPDPLSNRWDLGSDPLEYAKARTKLVSELWDGLVDRVVKDGEGYQKAQKAFGVLLGNHGQSCWIASRYVGGIYVSRSHKGDKDATAPFKVVDAAKQRAAVQLLEEQMFGDKPFKLPPELYNQLASTRWSHWGSSLPLRPDLAIHEIINLWQDRILEQLMSSLTLERLHDSELRVPADEDAFTTAELLQRLTKAIFAEVDDLPDGDYTPRKPAITSIRRNLQRSFLQRMSDLAMGKTSAPQDCQTVAYAELSALEGRIKKLLEKNEKLDTYSRAHLMETAARIHKVLDARMELGGGGGGFGFLLFGKETGQQPPQQP